MAKRVRLVDIAERLNITKVAVSKALRDFPDISQETKDLVKKTAAEMGYTPNLVARSLHTQKSNVLGVVVPKIAHTFFSSVIDAVQDEATKAGYGIVLAVSNENAELERHHIERLLAMRVDGLLVSVTKQAPELDVYQRVRDMHMPLVFFDRRVDDMEFSSVTVDDRQGAFDAVDYLIKQGYKNIAHVAGSQFVEVGRRRREGYEAALASHGFPINEDLIIEGGFDEQHGKLALEHILTLDELPDAIFVVTFPAGLGIYWAMRELRPDLIDTIQIVTFGTGSLNEFYTYDHICVQQPAKEIGQQAVRVLLKEIESAAEGPTEHLVLPTRLKMKDQVYSVG